MEVVPMVAEWECPGGTTCLVQHGGQLLEAAKYPLPLWGDKAAPNLGCKSALAQAVITKYPRLGGLNNRHFFHTVLEAASPRSECQYGQVLVRALFLACRRLPSHCVLRWRTETETSFSLFLFL